LRYSSSRDSRHWLQIGNGFSSLIGKLVRDHCYYGFQDENIDIIIRALGGKGIYFGTEKSPLIIPEEDSLTFYQRYLGPPARTVQTLPDGSATLRICRQPEQEQTIWKSLSKFGLKRGEAAQLFQLRKAVTSVDFICSYLPRLAEAGFEVYGEENIGGIRINRNTPKISMVVSSEIDWFDLKIVITFGDIQLSLAEFRRALKKRERYVKLVDGSIGELPLEWLERYRHVFELAEESDDGLHLRKSQITLLEAALDQADEARADAEFKERCRCLRDFTGIEPAALPTGLNGELRPYQKAGYDWLHFLHKYELGGCLADDMGIGKTAQALTLLASLQESGHTQAASLIVMPRSLLTNWASEAEHFTPRLHVLVHADGDRFDDQAHFDDYDLVLTGTPVENSTLDLWSQFAFPNPGMLGNLKYFRKEFANSVERNREEEAVGELRRLVYPFILRRTKKQVARELPLCTEHTIYCEMEPAQRKAYTLCRDKYRAYLLGMIEREGINNMRMKILEGLLRLRQICDHPVLVDPDFKGGSVKMDVLLEAVETLWEEGHKALVFSQFTRMLKEIETELQARRIPYVYLDGRTKERQERIDFFQNDPGIPLFLISLRAGGVGLNLTAADYVFHVDPWWNPAVERQATDRAHRIGQEKPVFVNKLVVRDSVEEKILLLQERKKDLVDKLITAESGFFKSLTHEDVRLLFS